MTYRRGVLCLGGMVLLWALGSILWVGLESSGRISSVSSSASETGLLILGAGLEMDGSPGRYLSHRLDTAIEVYKAGKASKILISGDDNVKGYSEIASMNTYLVSRGIPQSVIFGDYGGVDTYSSMYRARKVFGLGSALVVTQGFHLPRAVFLARRMGIEAEGVWDRDFRPSVWNRIREIPAQMKAVAEVLLCRRPEISTPDVDMSQGTNIRIADQQRASRGVYSRNMP